MGTKPVLLGRSKQTPIENQKRKEVTLPGAPSKDFILSAPCRIVNVGSRVGITASDLPTDPGGTYSWSSSSKRIRLINSSGPKLAVQALAVGDSRDSEVITCTRLGRDGSVKTKTFSLTVAEVKFKKSDIQEFGYDDFDTPEQTEDDHVCVQSESYTYLAVTIKGGAVASDFVFVCDDVSVCTAESPTGASQFDLKLRAGRYRKKATPLRAKIK